MKRLLSLLLILCLLPLGALADREKTLGLSESELEVLHTRFDELLEQTVPGEDYPDCCAGMSDKDRHLYALLVYDGYLRSSQGLCGFLLDEPEMVWDAYFAMVMIGREDLAADLRAFLMDRKLYEHGDTQGPELATFRLLGAISPGLAHDRYSFGEFDEYVEDGAGLKLSQRLVHFITYQEPLWKDSYLVHMTLGENAAYTLLWSLTDEPWPECAAALTEEERALCLTWLYLVEWECGGLCQWLGNSEPARLADTLPALERIAPDNPHTQALRAFLTQNGIDLTDEAALADFRALWLSDYEAALARYPFEEYDRQLMDAEPSLEESVTGYIIAHPDAFR